MRRGLFLIPAVLAICFARTTVCAGEAAPAQEPAVRISVTGGKASVLTDGKESSYTTIPGGGSVTITAEEGVSSIYVLFDRIYGAWTLSDGSRSAACGENGFLHLLISTHVDDEQLNGLWTVGVRNYPVCGPFYDVYSDTAREAYAHQQRRGYTKEDMILFQAGLLRRFRPHVAVGHDINGEYGHGRHRINSETLMDAPDLAADEAYDPDSAALYGVWDTPKAYIRLWNENPLVMDWDVPLDAFGGKTAFQVSQDGFRCHKSQHVYWFYGWIFGKNGAVITRADQIKTYSPCLYGLYRTNVGLDEAGGDMFERIPVSYAEIAADEARPAEEHRLALEAGLHTGALSL